MGGCSSCCGDDGGGVNVVDQPPMHDMGHPAMVDDGGGVMVVDSPPGPGPMGR